MKRAVFPRVLCMSRRVLPEKNAPMCSHFATLLYKIPYNGLPGRLIIAYALPATHDDKEHNHRSIRKDENEVPDRLLMLLIRDSFRNQRENTSEMVNQNPCGTAEGIINQVDHTG